MYLPFGEINIVVVVVAQIGTAIKDVTLTANVLVDVHYHQNVQSLLDYVRRRVKDISQSDIFPGYFPLADNFPPHL